MNKSKHLAWLDLEMTGLNSFQDTILEIAAIVTDSDLNIVAHGPNLIIKHSQAVIDNMDQFVFDMHQKSGLLDAVLASHLCLAQAETQVLEFFKQYGDAGTMPLCGNSIWQDKLFLINHMPNLVNFFHYRLIDVSTIKELVARWYGAPEFKKANGHRALQDIEESINELKFYRQNYFVSGI